METGSLEGRAGRYPATVHCCPQWPGRVGNGERVGALVEAGDGNGAIGVVEARHQGRQRVKGVRHTAPVQPASHGSSCSCRLSGNSWQPWMLRYLKHPFCAGLHYTKRHSSGCRRAGASACLCLSVQGRAGGVRPHPECTSWERVWWATCSPRAPRRPMTMDGSVSLSCEPSAERA